MLVKSIRGSIKYDGTVYEEGKEFEIRDTDFKSLEENIELIGAGITAEDRNKTEDLHSLTVSELRKIAEEEGINLKSNMSKAEILKEIEDKKAGEQ